MLKKDQGQLNSFIKRKNVFYNADRKVQRGVSKTGADKQKRILGKTFYNKFHSFKPKSRKEWVPRHIWLQRKLLRREIALYRQALWEKRREKWLRRNKRPFWKRKSFKRIRAEQNILDNVFLTGKKFLTTAASAWEKKNYSKKILVKRYYRRNTVRRTFKVRIVLRHYWKFRYNCFTHEKLQNFLKSVQRKSKRLLRFFSQYELVLFRYVRWWGLIPTYCPDKLASSFVSHGYIYVNFKPEVNPFYQIKKDDCVFSLVQPQALTRWYIRPKYSVSYGYVKHLSGRKEFHKPFKTVLAPWNTKFFRGSSFKKKQIRERWLNERWGDMDRLYLKLRSLLEVSSWSPLGLLHYSLVVETSYKIKIIVTVTGYEWFSIAFGATRIFTDINIIITNQFLNNSYY